MLGGSPRGGDGTNVVLNEGSARWLGVCIGKRVPVASGVRAKQPDLEAVPSRKFSGGGWWRGTAAVATAAVALRAEVSRACAAQAAFAP